MTQAGMTRRNRGLAGDNTLVPATVLPFFPFPGLIHAGIDLIKLIKAIDMAKRM